MSTSYSSSNHGQWQCPYCANDITEINARVVNHKISVSSIEKKMYQQRGLETYRTI